jgi:hypothetical protein
MAEAPSKSSVIAVSEPTEAPHKEEEEDKNKPSGHSIKPVQSQEFLRYHFYLCKISNTVKFPFKLPWLDYSEGVQGIKCEFLSTEDQNSTLCEVLSTVGGHRAIEMLSKYTELSLRVSTKALKRNRDVQMYVFEGGLHKSIENVQSVCLVLGQYLDKHEGRYVHIVRFTPTDICIPRNYQIYWKSEACSGSDSFLTVQKLKRE